MTTLERSCKFHDITALGQVQSSAGRANSVHDAVTEGNAVAQPLVMATRKPDHCGPVPPLVSPLSGMRHIVAQWYVARRDGPIALVRAAQAPRALQASVGPSGTGLTSAESSS